MPVVDQCHVLATGFGSTRVPLIKRFLSGISGLGLGVQGASLKVVQGLPENSRFRVWG